MAILNHGKLLKTGSVKDLTVALADAPVQMQLTGDEKAIRSAFANHSGAMIREVTPGAFAVEVRVARQEELDALVDTLRSEDVSIWRLALREQTLEEVFIGIVGAAAL